MNFYLVLTIAFGAITGVVDAPVMRPATLVAQRDRRVQRRIIRSVAAVLSARCSVLGINEPRTEDRRPRTRGVSRPRAPAAA
jgi:hypothetical protein